MIPHLIAWFPMILIGVGNGILRELTYGRQMSELRAHQLSTLLGLAFFTIYMGGVFHFLPLHSAGEAIAVGACWLLATVAFEFSFGRLIAKRSWARLLADYNLGAGRVWVLVPLWIGIAPGVFFRLGQ